MNLKLNGFRVIDRAAEELYELSSYLHKNPELGLREHKAHDYICSFLEKNAFRVQRNFVLETGFLAVYETAPKPHFVILVEMDALPDIGHACGHNLIAECSVAAGLGLMEIMKCHNLKGKLSLLGTPAEETCGGKITYVNNGFFKDVDVAIMSHPSNENVVHKTHLAISQYKISFIGKEAHAGASPWMGKNALDAAVIAYQSISCLRQQLNPTYRINGIFIHGGVATNIIPNYVEMEYEIRASTTHEFNDIIPKVLACFQGAGLASGCQVQISNKNPLFENLISNKILIQLYEENAGQLKIPLDKDSGLPDGSSDVGNVSHACPTIQPLFYIGTNFEIHTKEYAVETAKKEAQKYVLTQAKCIVGTLTDILCDSSGNYLSEMKEQFEKDLVLNN